MKKLTSYIFALLIAGITSCGNSNKPPYEINPRSTEDNKQNTHTNSTLTGAELYSQKCTACHGEDGNLGVAGAKKIPESVMSLEERQNIITNGKTTMPAFKDQLSSEEIKKVAEFTLTLK